MLLTYSMAFLNHSTSSNKEFVNKVPVLHRNVFTHPVKCVFLLAFNELICYSLVLQLFLKKDMPFLM